MAQVTEQLKKGGRYTKKEQEERRIQVYHLHFEENKPAAKVAELLNVNRNTINDDIQYWHKQIASEFKAQDLTAKMVKQIQRMEIQRDRLLEDLENVESFDEKIRLEKFISEIDNKLTQLFSKMISCGVKNLEPPAKRKEITEDEIKEFVRGLVLEDTDPDSDDVYSEDILKFRFIGKTKCDVDYANAVVKKMEQDGLVLCKPSQRRVDYLSMLNHDFSLTYNLARFAILRGYVTIDEFSAVTNERIKIRQGMEEEERKREERFIKKYGPKSQWSKEVKEIFDDPLEDTE